MGSINTRSRKGIYLFHTFLIILVWLSPFFLDWKYITLAILLLSLQEIIFSGCILTNIQFENKLRANVKDTMYSYYLEQLGFKPDKEKVKLIATYAFPIIILGTALLWQVLLNKTTLI